MQPQSVPESRCEQCSGKTAQFVKNRSTSSLKLILQPSSKTNPYQNLLIEQLEALGVQMEEVKCSARLLKRRQTAYVLHLHWLHQHFAVPNTVLALSKTAKFIAALGIKRLMGVKIVWTAHNLQDHENRNPFLDRICSTFVAKLAHAVITHCQLAKFQVAEKFHVWNHNKIFVVPHGNYIDYYENRIDQSEARGVLGISDSKLCLLFLGKIRPYKGVDELIEIFKQLHLQEVQLIVAGQLLNPQEAEQLNQKISSCENIKFVPDFIPDNQIQVYMKACDAVVFPYRDVLTSGAVLLAMSFGKTCIAPRVGCIDETLDDSGAFLYNPEDEVGLAQAINRAIHKKHALLDMGYHNRRLAEQWNWTRIAQMTLNVYQQCLNRKFNQSVSTKESNRLPVAIATTLAELEKTVRVLHQPSQASNTETSPQLVFENLPQGLLKYICQFMRVDTVTILLRSENEQQLAVRATIGLEEEITEEVRIPIGRGFAGKIADRGELTIVEDLSQVEVVSPILRNKGIRSMVGVPLQLEKRTIGVLHVGTYNRRQFSQDNAQFLQIVADRIAEAIAPLSAYNHRQFSKDNAQLQMWQMSHQGRSRRYLNHGNLLLSNQYANSCFST